MLFPLMLQGWHEISFFHWACDPAIIQPRLPEGIAVDTFEGKACKAWVSLTPFSLRGLRPPLIPRPLSVSFPETNLRTYVQGSEGPGIWFFSLDAANLSAVIGARAAYSLPYYWSDMQVQIQDDHIFYSATEGDAREQR